MLQILKMKTTSNRRRFQSITNGVFEVGIKVRVTAQRRDWDTILGLPLETLKLFQNNILSLK
jgi:hypothetical protein